MKRILVPVDFSKPSQQAVDYAVEFGKPLTAELILLHALEPVFYPVAGEMYGVGVDVGNVYDEIEHAARAQLARMAAQVRARRARVRTVLVAGTAAQVIVDTAKKLKADMIILSTHGRTGLSHVLLGSVAERVVRTAGCPVVTVRARGLPAAKRAGKAPAARPRGGRTVKRAR